MGEIEELKARLKVLQDNKKKDREIKKLKSQIKGEEFSQTSGGKVFNKIADVGQGLGKAIIGVGGSGATSPQKKKKVKSLQQVMDEMPQ